MQVPIQDIGLALPLLSKAGSHHGGGGNTGTVAKGCSNGIAAQN